jgi:ATP-dependent Clp protease ATP-binding subunit ClpA
MYERFSERARKVLQLANRHAQRLHHEYIGTEHFLLGLIDAGEGHGVQVLARAGIDLHKIRGLIERIMPPGPDVVISSKLPQTPGAKRVIEHAIAWARRLDQRDVGTEHLLVGLLQEKDSLAARLLMDSGLTFIPDPPPEDSPRRKELEAQIEELNRQKESAIAEQDFELAAHRRDEANRLKREMQTLVREWLASIPLPPALFMWNDGTIPALAREMVKELRWDGLPILADCLQEAGCSDSRILDHCYSGTEHGMHCWVTDLLLSRARAHGLLETGEPKA